MVSLFGAAHRLHNQLLHYYIAEIDVNNGLEEVKFGVHPIMVVPIHAQRQIKRLPQGSRRRDT